MTANQVLYCTLYNTKIGNLSGFKINVVEAHRYLFDLNQPQTAISLAIAHRLKATPQELANHRMKIEIALNPDSVSFETKIARGEIPAMPKWASVEVAIKTEAEMRIFDLIIGGDTKFKFKETKEKWKKRIDNYR